MKSDVLILSYNAYGRDFEAFMLLKYYLEHAHHLAVHLESVRDLYWLDRLQPTVLVVTDTKNPHNIIAARYAHQRGIWVVTIEGEGIFNTALGDEMIWGWNTSKQNIEHLRLQWSERNRRHITQHCPELASTIVVTGGGRFDRYRIYKFKSQSILLNQHRKSNYNSVIGYAGWGFSNLSSPDKRAYQVLSAYLTREQIGQIVQDRESIVRWLNLMVQTFPNVLFILKQHPGDDGSFTEIILHKPYENVLLLKNEEKIEDIINACDLWIDYSSTTSMEAWLLNRPTCSFVPSDTSFFRMGYEQGSVQIHNEQDLIDIIGGFVETGQLAGFDKLAQARQQLIETYIGWGDGFNSLRAAQAVVRLMQQNQQPTHKPAPITTRLYNLGRHIGRLILTRNGHLGYGGDGLKRSLVRMLTPQHKLSNYHSDGFVTHAIEQAQSNYYPQIKAFIATHQTKYDQILQTFV